MSRSDEPINESVEQVKEAIRLGLSLTKAERGAPLPADNPLWFDSNGERFYITVQSSAFDDLLAQAEQRGREDELARAQAEFKRLNDGAVWPYLHNRALELKGNTTNE